WTCPTYISATGSAALRRWATSPTSAPSKSSTARHGGRFGTMKSSLNPGVLRTRMTHRPGATHRNRSWNEAESEGERLTLCFLVQPCCVAGLDPRQRGGDDAGDFVRMQPLRARSQAFEQACTRLEK